jgi:hypothetical protein
MAIYCCQNCGAWNSCAIKWVRSEKDEANLCCNTCAGYTDCVRKDIESILTERSSRIDWLRKELNTALKPAGEDDYGYGLTQKDFKAFIANYGLTGFWILYGLETKFLEKNILYTVAIIPVVLAFWIILRKVQTSLAKK